jgi:hypothetical protein
VKKKPFTSLVGSIRRHWLLAAIAAVAIVRPSLIPLIVLAWVAIPAFMMRSAMPFRGFGWCIMRRWHKTVRKYRHVRFELVSVRYDPAAISDARAAGIAATVKAGLADLGEYCGLRLWGRVCVYVLPTESDIQAIFGSRYCGLASAAGLIIVIPANRRVKETIYHELSHLFTARWKAAALPLLNEGFATWWGQRACESNCDALVPYFATSRLQVHDLIGPNSFYEQKQLHAAYCIAGSFTDFLIRRYGKDLHRHFYSRATLRNFERCFLDSFGLTLSEADVRWRVEIATTQLLRQRLERELCC